MPNLPKIDVYNFRYKIKLGILTKIFFLSCKYINEYVYNKYVIKRQVFILHSRTFLYHFGKLQII